MTIQEFLTNMHILGYIDNNFAGILEDENMFKKLFCLAIDENDVELLKELQKYDGTNLIQSIITGNDFPFHNLFNLSVLKWLNESYQNFPLGKLLMYIITVKPDNTSASMYTCIIKYICDNYDIYTDILIQTILNISMSTYLPIFEYFIDLMPSSHYDKIYKLMDKAIINHDINALTYLLTKCPDLSHNKYHVLSVALDNYDWDVIVLLIKNGLDVFRAADINSDPRILEITCNMQKSTKSASYVRSGVQTIS